MVSYPSVFGSTIWNVLTQRSGVVNAASPRTSVRPLREMPAVVPL
jgi:hypothetical protein